MRIIFTGILILSWLMVLEYRFQRGQEPGSEVSAGRFQCTGVPGPGTAQAGLLGSQRRTVSGCDDGSRRKRTAG